MSTDSNERMDRRERLLEALRRVQAINGSPDIIRSIREALEDLSQPSE